MSLFKQYVIDPYYFKRENKTTKRIFEIDFLRGFCIFMMCLDHFCWDLGIFSRRYFTPAIAEGMPFYEIAEFGSWWWNWDVRWNFRLFVLATFFLISGISCNFSKNNIKRGLQLIYVGFLITVFTFTLTALSDSITLYILFGTISTIGTAVLIYALYEDIVKKFDKNYNFGAATAMILGIIFIIMGYFTTGTINDQFNHVALEDVNFISILEMFYGSTRLVGNNDFMPLFPYIGFMFFGGGLGHLIYKNKVSIYTNAVIDVKNKYHFLKENKNDHLPQYYLVQTAYCVFIPFKYLFIGISKFGKYTLIVYVMHQVILIPLTTIILYCCGYSLSFLS